MSRYDPLARSGETEGQFINFTTKDGLADNQVVSISQDLQGHIWFGTMSDGVSRYDGRSFQAMSRRDGLASNTIRSILQDREGSIWFGTPGCGVTRYRPLAPSPPPVSIHTVVADRRYQGMSELALPSTVGLIAFEFGAQSFKTRPEAMVYRYRLRGYGEDWKTTHTSPKISE